MPTTLPQAPPGPPRPEPRTLSLEAHGAPYLPLLGGPPGTVAMKAGLVTLAPGSTVGVHSTEGREEFLLILEGYGEFRITGGPCLPVAAGGALYCPPWRFHDVVNTGQGPLRYVYVVAGPPA